MTHAHAAKEKYTNALINEKSPYLQQHAHNPVNWYPWGKEAFDKAKAENKPVFLSIGYSTCHWCHVMEEESFENEKIAEYLNEHFVSIKVDREERPDIDDIYMTFIIATSGGGGWPMTVFLTPTARPFYGGTYFPPDDRYGRPGLMAVMQEIRKSWDEKRGEINSSGEYFVEYFDSKNLVQKGEEVNASDLTRTYRMLANGYDAVNGGFGRAPKFPSSHQLSFLMAHYLRSGESQALEMAETTLRKMAIGGIRDHLGGGFHRYSTDAKWFLPHFEKMLYDQAMMLRAYCDAYQLTGNDGYKSVAREIAEYVIGRMQSEEGGFYSAEDADSMGVDGKKSEGAYYVWSWKELQDALDAQELRMTELAYGVSKEGNVEHDPQGEFKGQNVLHISESIDEAAAEFDLSGPELIEKLEVIRAKLLAARDKRVRPHLDDKVLTDWNGLMIASLAHASRVLGDPSYASAAAKAARFTHKRLTQGDGRLWHRYRDGEAGIQGMLEDYAFAAYGMIELYEATFEVIWLQKAKDLTERMIWDFWDDEHHAFYSTREDADPFLIARPKTFHDGAHPSGNSIAVMDLLMLSKITMNREWEDLARKALNVYGPQMTENPTAFSQALLGLEFLIGPSSEIVIAGSSGDPEVRDMISAVNAAYLPNSVVILNDGNKMIELISPFVAKQGMIDGKPTAYVCRNYTCEKPVQSAGELKALLQARSN